ncbi:MAG: FAD-dependent oxidoreductase [bacterium]|nr:FAD-dependent oxidoreductase [bacterium]
MASVTRAAADAPVMASVTRAAADAPVMARSDVVVVGGGPAGLAAAVSAARQGASVTLLERYAYLGGLAAGGMVLVLDDFADGAEEVTVHGIAQEMVQRLDALGLAVYPPPEDRILSDEMWNRWSRWGVFDLYAKGPKKSILYAVAFDPDGWKRVSNNLVEEAGVDVRLHSWFSAPIMEGDAVSGVICETKAGPQAVLGDVVIDASGDADVAARAGAPFVEGSYMVTPVFRLGNVDTDAAEHFERSQPAECHAVNREARRILGGSWAIWWLKTPLPGVVWCNCPHMTGYDGLSVEDLTAADREGRKKIAGLVDYVRDHYPGFEKAVVIDVAPQIGVRQSRLIDGEYVVTKDDVVNRVHFTDSVARGRGYYTPYRAMLPRRVEQLLVAGRHYSVTPEAQKLSREIPPCMAMGEAAGTAAVEALDTGVTVRKADVAAIQRRLRRHGADPGDIPSPRARPASPPTKGAP